MTFNNTMIFGDSYSTFNGHIPEGYAFYYPATLEGRPALDGVCDTWWQALINETDSTLIRNDSWSGSTVGYTGYNNADTSKTTCFIHRMRTLEAEGFFKENKIDTVFIFGATNDSWADAPIGKNKYKNISDQDLYSVLPAVCYFLENIKRLLPEAKISFILNDELKSELSLGIIKACNHYGVNTVELENIDKQSGHPTKLGMQQIKNQVLKKLG